MTGDLRRQIVEWVDANSDDVIGLTRELVKYPSENKQPHGNERECQLFVADTLRDLGFAVDTFRPDEVPGVTGHPEYWPGREYDGREDVVGVWKARPESPAGLGSDRRSLLFTGHIDVVPAVGEGQHSWWDGEIVDGRLYGRGSNDMKGGIAAYITAARCIRELGVKLAGDLILETVVDEEFGGANGSLAARLRGYNADIAICPEPNNMLISTAHRGGQQYRLYTHAKSVGMGFGESVLPDPVSALGHLIAAIDRYNQERQPWMQVAGFEGMAFPLMPFALQAGEQMPWGTSESIPETAYVEFWIEIPPGVTKQQLQSELKEVVAKAAEGNPTVQRVSTRWEERTRFLAGSSMAGDHPVLPVLARNLEAATGQPPQFGAAPFACDGFMFNLHSPTPLVLFGPRGANAHAPDEWVLVEDLVTLTKAYALTIAEWLG